MIHLLGWLGTCLVVASYAQVDTVRLRQLSLVASVVPLVFNAWLGIWSNVALEIALTAINTQRLFRLRRARNRSTPNPPCRCEPGADRGQAIPRP